MKTLTLLAAVAALVLSSCVRTRCYVCTVTQHVEPYGIIDKYAHPEMVCDMTPAQIRAYEAANSYVQQMDSITITQTTTCR